MVKQARVAQVSSRSVSNTCTEWYAYSKHVHGSESVHISKGSATSNISPLPKVLAVMFGRKRTWAVIGRGREDVVKSTKRVGVQLC